MLHAPRAVIFKLCAASCVLCCIVAAVSAHDHVLEKWSLHRLTSEEPRIRMQAMRCLARLRSVKAIPLLIEEFRTFEHHLLHDTADGGSADAEADDVAATAFKVVAADWEAVDTLARIGPPAIPALRNALRQGDGRVQYFVLRSLEAMGAAAAPAVSDVIPFLQSSDFWHAQTALSVIGLSGAKDSSIVRAMIEAYTAAEPPDGFRVAELEDRIATFTRERRSLRFRTLLAEALGRFGAVARPALPVLRRARSAKESELREAASRSIQRIEGARFLGTRIPHGRVDRRKQKVGSL